MAKLYEITIPGLSMRTDFPAVRHRLLADFPDVDEVLATTTPATVLVAYRGEDEVDAWLDALSDSVATRRIGLGLGRPAGLASPGSTGLPRYRHAEVQSPGARARPLLRARRV
jgi:hypothetical protein